MTELVFGATVATRSSASSRLAIRHPHRRCPQLTGGIPVATFAVALNDDAVAVEVAG